MNRLIKAILRLLAKITLKCRSKCCDSECMLNTEENISNNNIDNVATQTN